MEFPISDQIEFWRALDTQTAAQSPWSKVQARIGEIMSGKKEQAMPFARIAVDTQEACKALLTAAFGHKICGAKTSKTWRGR